MDNITSKSTKAEILSAYRQLKEQPTTASDVWLWVTQKWNVVSRETFELVKDCYRLGAWARRCYDGVKAELARPIFKP